MPGQAQGDKNGQTGENQTGNGPDEDLRRALSEQPPLVLAGPTASGKTALALALARQLPGQIAIINADSMQVYRNLRILTARPSVEEEAEAPHFLFGYREAAPACSVAEWRDAVYRSLAEITARGQRALLVGGTGLYLSALCDGLSELPDVPDGLREQATEELEDMGEAAFHARLAAEDEASAALHPSDRQRMLRAWCILQATGTPLHVWQKRSPPDEAALSCKRVFLLPPRAPLYERINQRFEIMMDQGALDEVRVLLAQQLDPALPVMKAVGVPELAGFMSGELGRDAAIALACRNSRRYAKRQFTWFRNRPPGGNPDMVLERNLDAANIPDIVRIIRNSLLT